MKLHLYKTLWGFEGDFELACAQAIESGMTGIEGPAPADPVERKHFRSSLDDHSLGYIAEITTAGSYVPERNATLEQHLESLLIKLEHSIELNPRFITCLGGCDAWEEQKSEEFFHRAIELAKTFAVDISFETHRGRSLFNPWVTARMVSRIPALKLTVDFSHWCVVCERLIDTEADVIEAIKDNVHHIHARVGYDQGPQVPDPRAPEYQYALNAHQQWWQTIWQSQQNRDYPISTMTPEFGPDGYLQLMPYSMEPVADLWELNCWMAEQEREHFSHFNES